jgi:hypothetical protein
MVLARAQKDPDFFKCIREVSENPTPQTLQKWIDHPTIGCALRGRGLAPWGHPAVAGGWKRGGGGAAGQQAAFAARAYAAAAAPPAASPAPSHTRTQTCPPLLPPPLSPPPPRPAPHRPLVAEMFKAMMNKSMGLS